MAMDASCFGESLGSDDHDHDVVHLRPSRCARWSLGLQVGGGGECAGDTRRCWVACLALGLASGKCYMETAGCQQSGNKYRPDHKD